MEFFPHSPPSVAFQTPSWLLGRILKSIDPRVRLTSFTFLASLFALHYVDLDYLFEPWLCPSFLICGMCIESSMWERSKDLLTHCPLAKA